MEHSSDSRPDKTFLSLPIELRSLVYQNVLDIIQPPLHPWDELPKPKDYLLLLLVNGEVKMEISDLFRRLYADKLVLYFDNLLHIHWICQNLDRWPLLQNTRFWSRALLEDVEDDGDAKTDGALMLIDRQSDWKEEWDAHPGWFKTETFDFRWNTVPGHDWVPEADGFTRTTISHDSCLGKDVCVPFKKLVFPVMECGHRVTTHRWRLKGPLDNADIPLGGLFPTDSSAMVLEGKLKDLSFKDVSIETVRKRMDCQHRQMEEGREEEGHEDCGCYVMPGTDDPGYIPLPPNPLLEEMDLWQGRLN